MAAFALVFVTVAIRIPNILRIYRLAVAVPTARGAFCLVYTLKNTIAASSRRHEQNYQKTEKSHCNTIVVREIAVSTLSAHGLAVKAPVAVLKVGASLDNFGAISVDVNVVVAFNGHAAKESIALLAKPLSKTE